MRICVQVFGRRVTINVPSGTEEVTLEVPPPNGGPQKQQGPLIVLTDKEAR